MGNVIIYFASNVELYILATSKGVIMPRRYLTFCPGEYYHFYNRGVNRELIYYDDDNYAHFLWNIQRYLMPVANIGAYCLMPNHYHLLIVVKETSEVSD